MRISGRLQNRKFGPNQTAKSWGQDNEVDLTARYGSEQKSRLPLSVRGLLSPPVTVEQAPFGNQAPVQGKTGRCEDWVGLSKASGWQVRDHTEKDVHCPKDHAGADPHQAGRSELKVRKQPISAGSCRERQVINDVLQLVLAEAIEKEICNDQLEGMRRGRLPLQNVSMNEFNSCLLFQGELSASLVQHAFAGIQVNNACVGKTSATVHKGATVTFADKQDVFGCSNFA